MTMEIPIHFSELVHLDSHRGLRPIV